MREKQRWSFLILAVSLAVVLIAGCTDSGKQAGSDKTVSDKAPANLNAEGFPIVKEKITLKVMGSKAPGQVPWDQMTLFQVLEQKSNIHFEFDTPPNEAYEEKLNLAFATGSLPDILFGANLPIDKEVTYGQQGLLVPLEGYFDKYMPNLQKVFEVNKGLKQSITSPDGHIYSLPRINVRPDIVNTDSHGSYPRMWINSKWLNQLGLKMPATTDEFYNVLKAFKDKDPNGNKQADEIPLTAYKMDIRGIVMNWFGFVGTDDQLIDVKKDKVRYAPLEPEYKAYLTFMNKLYKEGLLDKESYSQSTQQRIAKGNKNQLGVFMTLAPFLIVGNDLDADYDLLLPLTSDVNKEKITSETSSIVRGTFAMTKANKFPEATMRLIDYLYSDEGSDIGQFGVEGVNWKFNDAKTNRVFIGPPGKTSQEIRAMATIDAGTPMPRNQSKLGAELATIENEAKGKNDNPTRYHQRSLYSKLIPFAKPVYPLIYFNLDEQKEVNVLQADILTYVEQMEAKFIFGDESLDKYNDFVNTLKKMKADRYVQIYQGAYDRWKKAK